jgi:hypothetical protein
MSKEVHQKGLSDASQNQISQSVKIFSLPGNLLSLITYSNLLSLQTFTN